MYRSSTIINLWPSYKQYDLDISEYLDQNRYYQLKVIKYSVTYIAMNGAFVNLSTFLNLTYLFSSGSETGFFFINY